MNRRCTRVALVLGLLAAGKPVSGQERLGLTAMAGGGYESGGPGPSLVASLADIGLDGYHQEGVTDIAYYPRYHDEGIGLVFLLGCHYRFPGPFSLDLLASNGSRGHAEGYGGHGYDPVPGAPRVLLRWSALAVSSTAGIHVGPVRLAVGPTLDIITWDVENTTARNAHFVTPVLGTTGTATVRVARSDVLISLTGGVRRYGTVELWKQLGLGIRARYSAWFIGVTFMPADPRL